jgi:hypothetical protein
VKVLKFGCLKIGCNSELGFILHPIAHQQVFVLFINQFFPKEFFFYRLKIVFVPIFLIHFFKVFLYISIELAQFLLDILDSYMIDKFYYVEDLFFNYDLDSECMHYMMEYVLNYLSSYDKVLLSLVMTRS